MNSRFRYGSALSDHIARFVEMKEAAGLEIDQARWILKEIDDYAASVGLDEPRITRELVDGWAKTRVHDSSRTLYAKYSVWRQLSCFMNRHGAQCFVPMPPRKVDPGFTPYVFTDGQVASVFSEVDATRMATKAPNVSLFALPALFRFLYSTGARISETLSLRNGDVRLDERHALIRNTKNDLDRIVPICESLGAVLGQYVSYRDRMPIAGVSAPSSLFFVKPDGTGLNRGRVLAWFKRVYMRCGIPYLGDHRGPRVHDLRHTFACNALRRMEESGMDVRAAMPILACELGHRSIGITEQYVRLTRTMYPGISGQCSELSSFVLPGPEPGEDGP